MQNTETYNTLQKPEILFPTYEPLGDVVLYENGFLCFEGSLFRVEEGAAYQRCLELCREALP